MPRRLRCALGGALIVAAALAPGEGRAALLAGDFSASQVLYDQCVMSLADHDGDGDTDGFDMLRWQRGMGLNGQTSNANGDSDRNGVVNGVDLPIWRNKYGTSGGLPPSTCWKLYLDPEGIVDGVVTAFVDSPDAGMGELRFLPEVTNGLFQIHPAYDVRVLSSDVLQLPGRQRYEARIRFTAKNPLNPPTGPVTLFGYQVGDITPARGLEGVLAGFTFQGGGFVTLYDTTTNQTTTLNESQLPDVAKPAQVGLLQPADTILAIDVDPPTSRSSYLVGQGPLNVVDGVATTQYVNSAKRNAGFITHGPGSASVVKSIRFRTSTGPAAGDPASWELYGTNSTIVSPDNSPGDLEPWTLIAGGSLSLPGARGALSSAITFANDTPYKDYRLVFPTLKDFRAAAAMEIGEVQLFTEPGGAGTNVLPLLMQFFGDPRAIHRPTSEADSPPHQGPEKLLDHAPYTKYRNLGRENAGFVVTPSVGPTIVESFMVTTANDVVGRDPASWALYGTNATIVSQDFSDGGAEPWTLIDSGMLALPDARLEDGPIVAVNNATPYLSYRLVFPTVKTATAGDVDSVQIGDIQFFGKVMGPPDLPVPEPASAALAAMGLMFVVGRRRARTVA